jgi:ribosomal protein L18E
MESKKVKSKNKYASKITNSKNKTCKNFCKEIFIPERERVGVEFSKINLKKNLDIYQLKFSVKQINH